MNNVDIGLTIAMTKVSANLSMELHYYDEGYEITEGGQVVFKSVSIDKVQVFLDGYRTALINNGLGDE